MGSEAHPDVLPQQVLGLAGALLFSGDDVRKKVSVLSGGEKSRVALGKILLKKAPCLLLDEPTNHLDFQTVEALTQSLARYPGTVVIVSHDRSFMSRVGTRVVEIRDGRAELYPGTYDEYVWSSQHGALAKREAAPPKKQKPAPVIAPPPSESTWELKKDRERNIRRIKRDIEETETALGWAKSQMKLLETRYASDPTHSQANQWVEEMGKVQQTIDAMESKWIQLSEALEALVEV